MKLILNHLLKDIRAQRWLLLLALLVIGLQIVIDYLERQPDYYLASVAEGVRTTSVLPLLANVLWIILLVRLIQSEPVTGTVSFWLTCPIPRRVYIPSKLLFILLFLLIPYLLPGPLDMLGFGVDSGQIGYHLKNSLIIDASLVLLILWLATYTRTMTVFWGVLIAFAVALIALFSATIYLRLLSSHSNQIELEFTRWSLFLLVFFVGLFVSLLIQHIRRKAIAGFRIGLFSMVTAVLMGFFWPFALPFTFTHHFFWGTSAFSGKAATIHFSDDWRQRLSWMRNQQTRQWGALGAFPPVTANIPEIPIIQGVTVTFQFEPGMPDKLSNGVAGSFPVDIQFDYGKAIAAQLPGVQFSNAPDDMTGGSLSLFVLDPATEKRLVGKTGKLNLDVYGSTQSLVREAEVPLHGNLLARQPGEIIHVARLPRAPQAYIANQTGDKPLLAVWTLAYLSDERFERPTRYYLLVDPQTRIGTFLQPAISLNLTDQLSVYYSKGTGHVYLPLAGDEPLDRMVLYIYKLKAKDFFNTALTVPDFTMNPK